MVCQICQPDVLLVMYKIKSTCSKLRIERHVKTIPESNKKKLNPCQNVIYWIADVPLPIAYKIKVKILSKIYLIP